MNGHAPPLPEGVDLANCQVNGRFEVVSLLREVLSRHALITIYFNEGHDAIGSTLLDVNPDFEELVIDCGADTDANARLLRAPCLTAVTSLDHIRIQFATGRAQPTTFQGGPAFRIRLPGSVLRLQRRNAYRVRVPMARPAHLRMAHPTLQDMTLKLKILDISVGGIAVLAAVNDGLSWERSDVIEGCSVELPDFGRFETALNVRYKLLLAETGRTKLKRYGMEFVGLPGPLASLVQRYILYVERSRQS